MPTVKCLTFNAQVIAGAEVAWQKKGLRTAPQAKKFLFPKLFDSAGAPLKSEKGEVVGRIVPVVLECDEDEARRRNYAPAPRNDKVPESVSYTAELDAKEQKLVEVEAETKSESQG